jgi:aspartyl/asparaginyl beta-hydroxylase (cupin superfamily)
MMAARLEYGNQPLERLEQSIAILKGGKKPANADPEQVADTLFIPGLTAKPWHDPQNFEWVPAMEASFEKIKNELLSLLEKEVDFNPYQHPYTKEIGWKGWGTYSLYRTNKWDQEHVDLCPATVNAIRHTPHGLRECMFTKLHPGSHITPHSGGSNVVLTCHLGLIIPSGCQIRVATETRGWQEGKCLIFDDSYMHEVWHRGDETRMVLLWDIWHPDLTTIEVSVLKLIFPIIDKFLENSAKV